MEPLPRALGERAQEGTGWGVGFPFTEIGTQGGVDLGGGPEGGWMRGSAVMGGEAGGKGGASGVSAQTWTLKSWDSSWLTGYLLLVSGL